MNVLFTGFKENSIPKDMYIIIREPCFAKYDYDNLGRPTIRISNPNDLIFNADHIFDIVVPTEEDHSI